MATPPFLGSMPAFGAPGARTPAGGHAHVKAGVGGSREAGGQRQRAGGEGALAG